MDTRQRYPRRVKSLSESESATADVETCRGYRQASTTEWPDTRTVATRSVPML